MNVKNGIIYAEAAKRLMGCVSHNRRYVNNILKGMRMNEKVKCRSLQLRAAIRDVVRLLDCKCARFRGVEDFHGVDLGASTDDELEAVQDYNEVCGLLRVMRLELATWLSAND